MRVTNSPASRKRRGRMLTAAKGFRLKRSKLYRYASDAVDHGRQYAYRDRRVKKRTFRYLWQIRINAAVREAGLTYSRFIEGLKAAKVALAKGFTTVYWFRGGFPEWESSGLAVESTPVNTADASKAAAAPAAPAAATKSR